MLVKIVSASCGVRGGRLRKRGLTSLIVLDNTVEKFDFFYAIFQYFML